MSQGYADEVKGIFDALKRCSIEQLGWFDLDGEPGEHRIAYSIVEMAEAAEKLLQLKGRLIDTATCEEGEALLAEFKDELEHLVYHIKDSGFFSSALDVETE